MTITLGTCSLVPECVNILRSRRITDMAKRTTNTRRSGKSSENPIRSSAFLGDPEAGVQERRSGYALKDDLVEQALITGEHRDLLETYFGEEAYEDLHVLATRVRAHGRGVVPGC